MGISDEQLEAAAKADAALDKLNKEMKDRLNRYYGRLGFKAVIPAGTLIRLNPLMLK